MQKELWLEQKLSSIARQAVPSSRVGCAVSIKSALEVKSFFFFELQIFKVKIVKIHKSGQNDWQPSS